MKIYTRTGDAGTTSLVGGSRAPKNDPRIEAYGTVDELMAHIGYLHDLMEGSPWRSELVTILDRLMTCASLLACEEQMQSGMPQITARDITALEATTDRLLEGLPELRHFTLPCGHPLLSYAHICRTVCRRAERRTAATAVFYSVPQEVKSYLNRLSDLLYALGRRLGSEHGAEDLRWEPKK